MINHYLDLSLIQKDTPESLHVISLYSKSTSHPIKGEDIADVIKRNPGLYPEPDAVP